MIFISNLSNWDYLNHIKQIQGKESILNALREGYYDIYYSLSSDESKMTYVALLKKEHEGKYPSCLSIAVYASGRLVEGQMEELDIGNSSLLIYLYEKEENEKDVSSLYKDIQSTYQCLYSLNNEEREQRKKIRKEFLDMVATFQEEKGQDQILPQKGLYQLLISFQIHNDNEKSLFTLRIHNGKKYYKVSVFSTFLESYKKEEEFTLSTTSSVLLKKDKFLPPYDEVMDELSRYAEPAKYYHPSYGMISMTGLCRILLLLKGKNVIYDDCEYLVSSQENKGNLTLKEDGSLLAQPKLSYDKYDKALCYEKNLIYIPARTRKISIYTFENASLCKMYYFLLIHGKDSFDSVKDIFQKKALPRLASHLVKSKGEKARESGLQIQLYVELDENDCLHFKSKYFYQEQEMSKEDLTKNPFHQVIIQSYLKDLALVGGVEEGVVEDVDAIQTFLTCDLSQLKKICDIYLSEELKRLSVVKGQDFQIHVSSGVEWLSVSVTSDKYSQEELQEILNALKLKKKFFILKDEVILLDDENLQAIQGISQELELNSNLESERVPYFETLKLKSYENDHIQIQLDEYLSQAISSIANFKKAELPLKEEMKNQLRSYQIDAIQWMSVLSKYRFSGILADDMGLGKTLETIAYIQNLNEKGPKLIICPKSLIFNWDNEFSKWANDIPRVVIEGSKEGRKELISSIGKEDIVYITSYDSLRNDREYYEGKKFVLAIIDEAQYIKNAKAKKSRAVKLIDAQHKFALTGTPIENSLSDLWSIFDFLMPGYFESYEKFSKRYEGENSNEDTRKELMKKVTPFILRRKKEEVLKGLPPKTVLTLDISMNEKQEALYQAYLAQARNELPTSSAITFLSSLMRLRQICVDPSIFVSDYDEISGKFSYTLSLVEESLANGHKVLLFSSFVKVLDHFRELLDEKDIRSYYINGDTSASLRVNLAEKFNTKEDVKVMLVSLKAGGTGLNLQGADIVVHLDPWWNNAAEEQATDRAYRIGQTRPVTVYKLISHDSVEKRVVELQEMKKDLLESVVKTGEENITRLSMDDMKFILS